MLRWTLVFCAAVPAAAGDALSLEFFESKVRPVLVQHCFPCHAAARTSGLDMTTRAGLLKGGSRGPSIELARPDHSLLLRSLAWDDEKLRMPPAARLEPALIAVLEAWVKAGAPWPEPNARPASGGHRIKAGDRAWWAFQPVRKPAAPAVRDRAWVKTGIDRFVLAALEARGMKPAPFAQRRALIRRAYYGLTGLPPKPEQIDAFINDGAPGAFANVVDRLLASPHYGERWGRYWLDVARYSDDKLNSTQDEPYDNAFRYRDWVIEAFNKDMPYDVFVKAQFAGDQLPGKDNLVAGLGFFALSPEFQDDRVDAATRGFLALTAACATCHDHKFDPIPTRDYYALLGVFTSTRLDEFPLAPEAAVKEYKHRKERIEAKEKEIAAFQEQQAEQLAGIFAARAGRYFTAAKLALGPEKPSPADTAAREKLDVELLGRWIRYLEAREREHPYLDGWEKDSFSPSKFQELLAGVAAEKKKIEDENFIRLKGSQVRRDLASADLVSLDRNKFFLWRDFFGKDGFAKMDAGVLYFKGGKLDRHLSGPWKAHLDSLRAELDQRKKELPPAYPYYHIVRDVEKPQNQRIRIRGSRDNLGEEAPRAFLSILSGRDPVPFSNGAGRLELGEAIASPDNPLTARVIANRIWLNHFGTAIVQTPSNFGKLGEKPSHPELLDYLASRLIEEKWSLKKLHREIMLSSVYQLAARDDARNFAEDPGNRLYWRANRRRLDVEALRDTLLAVTGEHDPKTGGPPLKISEESNLRRTVYGFVSRRKIDGTLALFDFPNPNSTSELRVETSTPLQQLYFLNSDFVRRRGEAFGKRAAQAAPDDAARIRHAYRVLHGRQPAAGELKAALDYLRQEPKEAWTRLAQALLSSNELLFLN